VLGELWLSALTARKKFLKATRFIAFLAVRLSAQNAVKHNCVQTAKNCGKQKKTSKPWKKNGKPKPLKKTYFKGDSLK